MKVVQYLLLVFCLLNTATTLAQENTSDEGFSGMDESVNENLAQDAGLSARDPFINLEALGEIWNTILLLAGGVCGFLLGRNWDLLWGRKSSGEQQKDASDNDENDRQ